MKIEFDCSECHNASICKYKPQVEALSFVEPIPAAPVPENIHVLLACDRYFPERMPNPLSRLLNIEEDDE